MNDPLVTVVEFPPDERCTTLYDFLFRANLPDLRFEPALRSPIQLETIRRNINGGTKRAFLLVWKGIGTPCGAIVNGRFVGRVWHSVVLDTHDRDIGTCQRLVEYGGDDRRLHVMVVYVDVPKKAVAPAIRPQVSRAAREPKAGPCDMHIHDPRDGNCCCKCGKELCLAKHPTAKAHCLLSKGHARDHHNPWDKKTNPWPQEDRN